MIYICRVMPRCRSCIAGALHRTYEDAGIFWMQPGIGCSPASDAARHRMPRLVNAKPKKVPASSYVRCQDAAPLSKRSKQQYKQLRSYTYNIIRFVSFLQSNRDIVVSILHPVGKKIEIEKQLFDGCEQLFCHNVPQSSLSL